MKTRTLLTLFGLFWLTACTSQLPAGRPSDFAVNYGISGGMMPYGSSLYIDNSHVTTTTFNQGVTIGATFTPSASELDALYQTILDSQFDRIQTYEEQVYDRGGSSISVTVNGETYNKADGGMSYIQANWQTAYNDVEQAINALVNRNAPEVVGFIIEWDASLATQYPTVEIAMGSDFVSMSAPMDSTQATFRTNNPKGSYVVSVTLNNATAVTASTRLDLNQTLHLKISQDGGQVLFAPQP